MSDYSSPSAIEELAEWDQWVTWRAELSKANRLTKVPYNAKTGNYASTTDPKTWCSYKEAAAASDKIGFVFTAHDPYVGIDLDDCYAPETGKLTEEAAKIVRLLDSYTEISPSGTGIKIFCRGTLDHVVKSLSDAINIEMYATGRYFTVTGQHFPGTPNRISNRPAEIDLLAEHYGTTDRKRRRRRGTASLAEITAALESHQVASRLIETNYATIVKLDTCLTSDDHDDGAWFTVFANGTAQYGCYHNSCATMGWADAAIQIGLNPEEIEPLPASDEANAERLIQLHGRDWRYCAETKHHLLWNGTHWEPDRTEHILQLAKDVGKSYLNEANREGLEEKDKTAITKQAQNALENPRLVRMVASARVDDRIAIRVEALDTDPWLLNCPNGTVHLRTGKLQPHRREDLITRITNAEYDPRAALKEWDQALLAATEGYDVATGDRVSTPGEARIGAEKRAFLQRLAGISATGDASEEFAPFLHGPPRSGKGTILSPIIEALGDYAKTTDFNTLLKRSNPGGIRTDLVRMNKARMVASVEVENGRELATALFKRLTGGDTQTARGLYTSEIVMKPTQTYWLVANQAPRIDPEESSVWRRILCIPFEYEVPVDKTDPSVKRTLMHMNLAGPAILAWIVQGCTEWQQNGIGIPTFVQEATEKLRQEMDTFGEFLAAETELAPEATVGIGELKDRYLGWYRRTRQPGKPLTTAGFKRKLRERGIIEDRVFGGHKATRIYRGIRLEGLPGTGDPSDISSEYKVHNPFEDRNDGPKAAHHDA